MNSEVGATLAIAQRDVVKLLRDGPRLAVNLAFPILLVGGLGSVLQYSVGRVTGLDAISLAFSGVLAATLFQSTAAGMISIVEDRETDFSRELFVTPVSRLALITGKIVGETLVAVVQGCCVLVFGMLFGVRIAPGLLGAILLVCVGCCLVGCAFGLVTIAVLPNQRAAMNVFQFLIIPQYVLAGVLVPLHGLPRYLDALTWAMPLRYAVDLSRAVFYAGTPGYREVVTSGPLLDVLVLSGVFLATLVGGAALFDYRERTR